MTDERVQVTKRHETVTSTVAGDRSHALRADCRNCAGLCCVALAFARPGGFAFDKEAGDPCTHLEEDFRCEIHPVLRKRGFPGCTVFDCQGAGQKITQVTFGGDTWRERPEARELMFAAFQVMRPLHELLWYLNDAMSRPEAAALHIELTQAYERIDGLTKRPAEEITSIDLSAERERVSALLASVSELVRADASRGRKPTKARRKARPGADLIGADLAGQDLQGVELRGAHLIAADLRGANLGGADMIGADLRNADVSATDLSHALYLTQFQVNAARGSTRTRLPSALQRPTHWTG